jgi:predicted ABC-type ATPase
MKEMLIVAGANGSGKTTFAKSLLEELPYVFLNADEIEKELTSNSASKVSKIKAGRIFFERLKELTLSGQSFILESTLSGNYLEKAIVEVKAAGYTVSLLYIFLESPQICIERIKVRVSKGGHYVPDEDVVRRYYRSKRNLWHVYRKLADEWRMYYNSDEKMELIGLGKEDTINILDNTRFDLFLNTMTNGD